MYILNTFQRRTLPGRVLLAAFYLILVSGAIWMVCPFLIMLGGSFRTDVDYREADLIPAFLTNDAALFRKFEEQRYWRIDSAIAATGAVDPQNERLYGFDAFPLPARSNGKALQDWQQFLESERPNLPYHHFALGHSYSPGAIAEIGFRYSKALQKAFPDSFETFERTSDIVPEEWGNRNFHPPHGPRAEIYWKLRNGLPDRYFYPVSLDGAYAVTTVGVQYGSWGKDLERLNRAWGTSYQSLTDVVLKPEIPQNPAEQVAWSEYVRYALSPRFLKFDPRLLPEFRKFLQLRYETVEKLNAAYGTTCQSWEEAGFPASNGTMAAFNDAAQFVEGLPDLSLVSVRGIDIEWRDYLKKIYGNEIAALNRAWESRHANFDGIHMPVLEHDWSILEKNKSAIRWDYLTRNYRAAWNMIVLRGNALRNTIIFCVLNVLMALLINPLAAYALSRFQPAWGQLALFVLLATMTFPGEVAQIPVFLHLRDLGWLNTFAALVIPSAAHGYSIFLLKGFFDSLPGELYEQATLDGCGEVRAFFHITLPLSGPVLAVVALGAFASAYGAFMFALLVCQKESMWTLMVYIYQLQQYYKPPIVFAALVIAAIPTLLVFICCQKIIMRGVIIPLDK